MSLEYLKNAKHAIVDLREIEKHVENCEQIKSHIALMEKALKEETARLRSIERETIPQLLKQAGIKSVKTEKGKSVAYVDDVSASISKSDYAKRKEVFEWIENNGGANLLKNKFIIEEGAVMEVYVEDLQSLFQSVKSEEKISLSFVLNKLTVPYTEYKDIHHQTLNAFMRELLGLSVTGLRKIENDELPEGLNVFEYSKTIIK